MPDVGPPLRPLWDRLRSALCDRAQGAPLVIAFSGGLDSRFLAHAALRFGLSPRLLHVAGPHVAADETVRARHWARNRNLPLRELELDPLDNPAVAAGAGDRCYHCKRLLFAAMLARLEAGAILCDGSNASDQDEYRPGLRAVRELGVRSPLAEAGLRKTHIHELAAQTGLDRPGQRPRPCLLTRFAYGLRPTRDALARLDKAEAAVAALLCPEANADGPNTDGDAPDFRLRLPRPGALELHCERRLSLPLLARIQDAVAALGLPRPEFVHLAAISGYFDARPEAP